MRLKILHDGGKGKVRSWLMPPVSSVLENCVVGKEGGNESQPVGGLRTGRKPRRAGGIGELQEKFCHHDYLHIALVALT